MENQPIEAIELDQEPWRRREKLRRIVGATIFSMLALTGAFTTGSKAEGDSRLRTEVSATEFHPSQVELDREEVQALKEARIKSYEIRQRIEKFYNTLIWNKAVEDNKKKARIPYDPKLWEDLHQCEQGDSWYASGYNKADPGHQLFQGGLGMSTASWRMAVRHAAERGVTLPSSALDASIDQQMQGAEAFMEGEGWGWGCHVDGH